MRFPISPRRKVTSGGEEAFWGGKVKVTLVRGGNEESKELLRRRGYQDTEECGLVVSLLGGEERVAGIRK
jgi:hypothetical protein